MRTLPLPALLFCASVAAQNGPFTVKALGEVAIYPEREASAQAVALNESRIAAEIAGRIEAIPALAGGRLSRGAVVAKIDCRDHELAASRARAALEATRARLALAEQQLDRARGLQEKGFISPDALAARDTEVRVLRAETAQARAQRATAARAVEKCVVRAPFAAIVRDRLADVGELAAPGTPLATLIDAERIEVAAQVQTKDIESLKAAKDIAFEGEGGVRPLKLLRVSPAIDPQARTAEARLGFVDGAAAPGAAGRIRWRDSQPHVPPELVVRREGRLGVFVDEGGVARFKPLAGAQEGRPAPIGLPREAKLVVSGQLALRDGQPLK